MSPRDPGSLERMRVLAAIVAAVIVLAGMVGVLVFDASRSDRIAEGASVAGIDVGGQSVEEARALLRDRLRQPARRDLTVRSDDETFVLAADEANVELDVEATVEGALQRSRSGNPWSRTIRALTGGTVDADLAPVLAYDESAVGAFVKRVGDDLDHRPQDADIDPRTGQLEVIEDEEGFRTDREALLAQVTAALERPRSDRELDVPGETLEPETTMADLREGIPTYLIVDRENFRLRVYDELELDRTYRIGVGQAGHETPAGRYEITPKDVDPAWHVPDKPWAGDKAGQVIPPGDPDNPLEARWLGIEDGVGIHGTEATGSIGNRASHGCIRMTVPDVKEVYDRVPTGTPIYIA